MPAPHDSVRCLDPNCRKKLPPGLNYCPYCGMPVWQTKFAWRPEIYRRVVAVVVLMTLCGGVYLGLGYLLTPLWHRWELAMATATLTPQPTATLSPTPSATPFPKLTLTATPTPRATPTNVIVIQVTPTAFIINGTISGVFRLYEQPTYESSTVMEFTAGEKLEILGRDADGQWLQAKVAGFTGWVKAELVRLESPWTLDNIPLVGP